MGITRDDVIWRTNHVWAEGSVPYSMSDVHYPDGYRADCSGYVSMCWMVPPAGGSTVTLVDDGTMYEIPWDQLKPGDAVGNCGPGTGGAYGHIQLFECWDPGGGYWVWEQSGGGWGPDRNYYRDFPSGYRAWRFVGIIDEEQGMSEREAQLSASWTTTGSDVNGWAGGYPEADSVKNYANRQVEERLTAKLSDINSRLEAMGKRMDDLVEALRYHRGDDDDQGEGHGHDKAA